jgi:hypothetical protein
MRGSKIDATPTKVLLRRFLPNKDVTKYICGLLSGLDHKMVQVAISFNDEILESSDLADCATLGYIEVMEWMFDLFEEWPKPTYFSSVVGNAAEHGHLDCLEFAITHGAEKSKDDTYKAAGKGNFECLKFLLDQKCRLSPEAAGTAAARGHLDC